MEKGEFWPPGPPKPLNGFRWNFDYITTSWVWPDTQTHVALRQHGWSGRTRDMSPVRFLSLPFKIYFALYFSSRLNRTSGPILVIYTSSNMFQSKEMLIGVSFILHSHKDHQIPFVVGTNTRKTNPRWRTAAISKNRKSAISPQQFDLSA